MAEHTKLTDMGRKINKDVFSEPKKNEKNFPGTTLLDPMPEGLFEKKVGTEVRMEVVARIVNKGVDETTKRKDKNLRLDFLKMGIISNSDNNSGHELTKKLSERD